MDDLKERLLGLRARGDLTAPSDYDLINPDGPEAVARIEKLEAALAIAFAAIDDHNEHRLLPRSVRIEEFYMPVSSGSKITCLSDARQALQS